MVKPIHFTFQAESKNFKVKLLILNKLHDFKENTLCITKLIILCLLSIYYHQFISN
jgi:hypothetical protein